MGGSLLDRAVAYAEARDIDVRVVDGPAVERYFLLDDGHAVRLFLDAGTAHGPTCGEVVYRACEALRRSRALEITVTPIASAPIELRAPA